MSQLFGFPQGLSGGSKETIYNTSHTTSATTSYPTSWNTSWSGNSWVISHNTTSETNANADRWHIYWAVRNDTGMKIQRLIYFIRVGGVNTSRSDVWYPSGWNPGSGINYGGGQLTEINIGTDTTANFNECGRIVMAKLSSLKSSPQTIGSYQVKIDQAFCDYMIGSGTYQWYVNTHGITNLDTFLQVQATGISPLQGNFGKLYPITQGMPFKAYLYKSQTYSRNTSLTTSKTTNKSTNYNTSHITYG